MKEGNIVENLKHNEDPEENLALKKLKQQNQDEQCQMISEQHDEELKEGLNDRLRGQYDDAPNANTILQPDVQSDLEDVNSEEDEDLNYPLSALSIWLSLSSNDSSASSVNDAATLPVASPVIEQGRMYLGSETIINGVIVRNKPRRRWKITPEIASLAFLSLVLIIAAIIWTSRRDPLKENFESPSLRPSLSPSISSLPTTIFDYDTFVKEIALQVTREQDLINPNSAQHKVWKYFVVKMPSLIESGRFYLNSTKSIKQLYTLSVIHISQKFSTSEVIRIDPNIPFPKRHVCDFPFYTCNDNLEITSLFNNNIQTTEGIGGFLATEIGTLSELRQISYKRNGLIGPIPSEIGKLKHLRSIGINGNSLTGEIPTEIGLLENLELIDLNSNLLEKTIPPMFGNLEKLQYFDLSYNMFTGSIPMEIASLSKLKTLKLQNNSLTGNVDFFCNWDTNSTDQEQFVVVGEKEILSYFFEAGVTLDCA